MIRALRKAVIVTLLAASTSGSGAQPAARPPSAPAALDEAKQLTARAEALFDAGKYQEALAPAERAVWLREKLLGPTSPALAESLNILALLHKSRGRFGQAEPLFRRALAIRKSALGPEHPDVAESLNNLAVLYESQAMYSEAEPLLVRSLEIREKALGPEHPDVANSLNNLAMLHFMQGAYARAEPLFDRALRIREQALGPDDPDLANSLNNLAGLVAELGQYDRAEQLFGRALQIYERALGTRHPLFAQGLNNLAMLYQYQGAYSKAEPLYRRALEVRETTLGSGHPAVAQTLNNLAELYRDQRAYDEAEPLYLRALGIQETAVGKRHRDVAVTLNNLALLYWARGAYDQAEPLFVRALDIFRSALGPAHRQIAQSLNNLALLYWAEGARGKAAQFFSRALAIYARSLGPTHPESAQSLNNLGLLSWSGGAYPESESRLARAAEIREQQLRTQLVRLTEPRKRALLTLLQQETNAVVSLHAEAPGRRSALALAFTTVLRRKGRILDSLVDGETRLRGHLTPGLRDQLAQLSRARSELAAYRYAPAGPPSAADRARAAVARARIDELEASLSAASSDFHAENKPVTLASVQATIPERAALVEFVHYQRFDVQQLRNPRQEERYVAYLLTAHGGPQSVALGDAASINAQIDAVRAAVEGRLPDELTRAALQRLDHLVLAPIRDRLSGVSHLILAPDGQLNLVPFDALIDARGRYALDDYLVSYVTSGRDLLRLTERRAPRSPAVIVAAPEYGSPPPAGPSGVSFVPLPGALAEAADLQGYFAGPPLTGGMATRSALAALSGPAMIHIATHGFAAGAAAASQVGRAATELARRELDRGMFVGSSALIPRADDLADALDRSGLALAGANLGASGIVTAREIAGFDWWGTQLVVLSACVTGVGAVSSGDGVYGMRRALVLAGTASQVVSLWGADDTATRVLMRDFYAHLARGTGRAEALRQAKRDLLRQPQYEHPYYWAAFIPAGDWRPLDKSIFSRQGQRP